MTDQVTYYLGIDPGLQGALALYEPTSALAFVYDMPPARHGGVDGVALNQIVKTLADNVRLQHKGQARIHAVVEQVGGRPRQAGVFNFGLSAGVLRGVLAAHGIPFELVPPSAWKPAMGLRKPPTETVAQNKSKARALAAQLFPSLADQFARVKDDGRAEALLIAVYHAAKQPGAHASKHREPLFSTTPSTVTTSEVTHA